MNGQDAYYIALILDPRFKTLLLEKELGDAAPTVIRHLKDLLHQQYSVASEHSHTANENEVVQGKSIEARLLEKLQGARRPVTDIDRYFEAAVVTIDQWPTNDNSWLLSVKFCDMD
ncbi:hypothetical protein V1517DRAFT_310562 [Lipomyces orientalis]|uniref:Uncharacterized protein n=1 Tax=Lipomyces orientalis TaxID=1233043 RepID=A0ACC3TEW2_9ASCO